MQILSFFVSIICALLWYYLIMIVVENINNLCLIVAYGCGNGLGDVITIRFDAYIDKMDEFIAKIFHHFCRNKNA